MIAVSGLSKVYGATRALDDVTFDVRAGEIVGLIGTNGAGKSTLIKVLSGAVRPSSGTITLDGRPFEPRDPLDAQAAGVQTVHQNIDDGIVPGATVAENLTLDLIARPGTGWFTTRSGITAQARAIAAEVGLPVPLGARVEALPASDRQQVVIARALSRRARLLVFDEPTSTLSATESEVLTARVRESAASGVGVLYVSHRLADIESLCDRVVVLRDGRLRRVFTAPFTRAAIVRAMLGEMATHGLGPHGSVPHGSVPPGSGADGSGVPGAPDLQAPSGAVVLSGRGVRVASGRAAFDFEVRAGEVLGVTGLVGAGKTELLEQLAGARPLVSGELRLDGRPYRPRHVSGAIAAGVAFAGEERSAQAVVPGWSVRALVTLPWLRAHSRAGLLSRRSEAASARRVAQRFGVRLAGVEAPIETLSGGNQQKVVVGRWLEQAPRVLLLDEPFRGVDVGARATIGQTVREAARGLVQEAAGNPAGDGAMAVVVASSDPQEIVEVADRVLVLHEGVPAGELAVADATPERLAALMSGSDHAEHAGEGA
ncbi:sugar ABC transporter ATP-binding protein [Nonomuraea sp. M3C6]|uniref:Sugar ABC transporter ATP-binding protein n=1 Tax=Nonomuraea marmarensis TaxID=3351344 RepID=A0ABW7AEP7_9ACTN